MDVSNLAISYMNMSDFCIAITTFGSKEQATPVIDAVLNQKLAACIQTMDINSHYTWNEEICHDSEVLVLFKTRSDLYKELEETVLHLHPYDTPELVMVDIESGFNGYLNWIRNETK